MRGDVAGDARVDVVVPGAADPGRLLQDDKVLDAGVQQPLGLAQPGHSGADDDNLQYGIFEIFLTAVEEIFLLTFHPFLSSILSSAVHQHSARSRRRRSFTHPAMKPPQPHKYRKARAIHIFNRENVFLYFCVKLSLHII